jgi:creatinine amidohydrolase
MAAAMDSRKFITYGSYQVVGRLEDMPVNFSVPQHPFDADQGMTALSRHLIPGQSDVGRFYSDPSEHGGWPTAVTPEQRAEWGKKGEALIESQVNSYDVAGMLDALRQHDQFTRTLEKKYGTLLPPGPPKP